MELTPTPTTTPDTDNDGTPPHTLIQQLKPLSYPTANGHTLKKHHHHHYPSYHLQQPPYTAETAVVYKECLKNHAATLGGHALDGCGEYMPSPATPASPALLKCAACGCHRNFHRRETNNNNNNEYNCYYYSPEPNNTIAPHLLDFRRPGGGRSSHSPSPPPPPPQPQPNHPLLALSSAAQEDKQQGLMNQNPHNQVVTTPVTPTAAKAENLSSGRKRFRTKFSQEQKEKMHSFAEKLGWKMQRSHGGGDDSMVQDFCNEIGVSRGVLKVWMHNNKSKKDNIAASSGGGSGAAALSIKNEENSNGGRNENEGDAVDIHASNSNNGLSSSSSPSTS